MALVQRKEFAPGDNGDYTTIERLLRLEEAMNNIMKSKLVCVFCFVISSK